jgi:hypothetical protein
LQYAYDSGESDTTLVLAKNVFAIEILSRTSASVSKSIEAGISKSETSKARGVLVPTPPATATHRPVPHHVVVEALVETLGLHQIGVIREEYAVSSDGMKMFGVRESSLIEKRFFTRMLL